jgi:hypothetical protein
MTDQYQSMPVVYSHRTLSITFPAALINQPTSGQLAIAISLRICFEIWVLLMKMVESLPVDNRILKEAASVRYLRDVRQLLCSKLAYGFEDMLWAYCALCVSTVQYFFSQIAKIESGFPCVIYVR